MDKKANVSLKLSFCALMALFLFVFLFLTSFLSNRVHGTINEVSEFYISAMNSQLQEKFSLVIQLTSEKLDGIVNRTPPQTAVYGEDLLVSLRTSTRVRSFLYLGLLREDGTLETVYGQDTRVIDGENVLSALEQHGQIAEMGLNMSGERCLLLGKEAHYPTADGSKSLALVAGVSTGYLSRMIFPDAEDTGIFCHIINANGTYVIRTALPGSTSENYKDYVLHEMKGISPADAERYLEGLEASIRDREPYTTELLVQGEQRQIYCVPLEENSTWYLITVMPSGLLDNAITTLDRERAGLMSAAFLVTLVALMVMFLRYHDISRRQMAELEAAREEAAQANRSKSAFLSSMSHDIRTPMNAIVGMSEIALRDLDDAERVEDCLRKVKLSSKQLLGLINNILDISKIESGKMVLHDEELSLRETMEGIVSIIQPQVKANRQHFDIFIQDILSEHVWCDGVRLNQILLNLLSNALKFTPEGGQIDMYLSQEPSPRGDGSVRTRLRVNDTGIGMSPEFLERLFDSFEREATNRVHHTSGSGLGMNITKRIVELMGGTIEVHSEQGKGTTFQVTLDLQRAVDESEMKLPHWNILVVDDSQPLCESAASNLEELGLCAEWALDCGSAMRMVEDRHQRGEDYHFVLVDWEMPYISGLETIQKIRGQMGDAAPIYLISAYDWTDIKEELGDEKIAGFIAKPLFRSTLYHCLSQYAQGMDNPPVPVAAQAVDLTGKRVLLAEDNDLNWEVAAELLGETGLKMERAVNGQVCLDMFLNSAPGYYNAILMDVHMPVMDGYESTRRIRASGRPDSGLPIIAMTADAFSDDVQQCLDAGMDYHLSKPLDFQTCKNVLARYL